MSSFNLKAYLDQYTEICRQKFKREYDYPAVEKELAPLRKGAGYPLNPSHVLRILDPSLTPFSKYWPRPDESVLRRKLDPGINIGPLPDQDKRIVELIKKLLDVFQNIGIVSLILRFVYPERFGIFSTPIVYLLQIHRPTVLQLYFDFCEELKEWQAHFGVDSVAETEMGIWAFHQISSRAEDSLKATLARREFDNDVWIQRRRLKQTLGPFVNKYGSLEFARILIGVDPNLAAMIAGREYERLLRIAAEQYCPSLDLKRIDWASKLFPFLPNESELRKIWRYRGQAVHAEVELRKDQAEEMISMIIKYCASWVSKNRKQPLLKRFE